MAKQLVNLVWEGDKEYTLPSPSNSITITNPQFLVYQNNTLKWLSMPQIPNGSATPGMIIVGNPTGGWQAKRRYMYSGYFDFGDSGKVYFYKESTADMTEPTTVTEVFNVWTNILCGSAGQYLPLTGYYVKSGKSYPVTMACPVDTSSARVKYLDSFSEQIGNITGWYPKISGWTKVEIHY